MSKALKVMFDLYHQPYSGFHQRLVLSEVDESSTSASQWFSPSFAALYKSLPKSSGSIDKDFMVVCSFELWFRKCVRVLDIGHCKAKQKA